ncbi:MAG: TldD/PmbA family protein [Firmicutes bacterium HGW-Firmicutes-12]|nr:MAG: TldD/PmbA family protein [Firmicutes bacterium HGW-Firmicutes-12]
MQEKLQNIAEKVLELACLKGDLQTEVFMLDAQELSLEVSSKEVENMKISQERGLGLRVIKESRLGYAYTSDLSKLALESVVDKAIYNSRETQPDSCWELPKRVNEYQRMSIYDEQIFKVPVEEKIKLAQSVEEAARNYDARVAIIEKAVYQEAQYHVTLLSSLGLSGHYQAAYCGSYAAVVGRENDDNQTGFGMQFGLKYSEIDPKSIGEEAAMKAVRMLGAKTIPSANIPIVFDPYIGTKFLGVLQIALSGEAVLKGKSFYRGKEGMTVASPLITIIDDGTMPNKLGSTPFDGEGIPTTKTVLVENGRLIGYLHNLYTAGKSGVTSTGNSVRGSYKSTPEVGTTNLYLQAGETNPLDIVKEIKRGLYVTDIMGMHTANPVSGDFSLGAAGLLIENGELTHAVKGVAIAGNIKEMLESIDAVGNDLTFFIAKGAPTIRVKAMSVSGA